MFDISPREILYQTTKIIQIIGNPNTFLKNIAPTLYFFDFQSFKIGSNAKNR